MKLLRLFGVVGVIGTASGLGVALLNSRWGPKARLSAREFHRASYNQPPSNWSGPVFQPQLDYSTASSAEQNAPWEEIDFRTQPEQYMQAVLDYCYDGNVENEFEPRRNTKRRWYHAPWMSQTAFGREPIHGLTFERPSESGYLANTQTRICQSWAVGMYNEPGAYTLNQVWHKVYEPDIKPIRFPNRSVGFKLLFTDANSDEIPFLSGSPEWMATLSLEHNFPYPTAERTLPQPVRLLQVDIAVRDSRADDTTGWVFASYQYHNSIPHENPWKRLMPVCLMWGNDPDLTPEKYEKGERPKESWLNPAAVATLSPNRPYFGWLGRANGPVDNYTSSCIACHSTANVPEILTVAEADCDQARAMLWFRNIAAGEMFGFHGHSLDYSLQLSLGLGYYEQWSKQWCPEVAPLYRAVPKPPSEFPEPAISQVNRKSDYKKA